MAINAKTPFLLFVAIFIGPTTIVLGALYTGYSFYDTMGWPPPNGVSADIYTINNLITGNNFYTQWSTVIFSYRYNYFIQIGYSKDFIDNFQRKYYVEWRVGGGGGLQKDWGGPTLGSTKHYYIELPSSSWRAGVSGVFTKTFSYTNFARDYQAYTETSSSEVKIDGTHFSYLSYRQNNDWILWYRHVPNVDTPPYYLIEKSHYEFEAYGGGGGG